LVGYGGSFTVNRHAWPLSDTIVPEERNARGQGVEQAWRETNVLSGLAGMRRVS